jgi:phosphate transport system substrate-binding protein
MSATPKRAASKTAAANPLLYKIRFFACPKSRLGEDCWPESILFLRRKNMSVFFCSRISSLAKSFSTVAAILLCVLTATAQDKIVIRGSNTIGEELAPRLISEYQKDHKDAAFDLEFKGTAYGLGALMGNFCDIAAASKPVGKEQEEIAHIRNFQFKEYVLGSYVVTILVNSNNPISNLSSNQVQALFTGQVQNWKDIGGPDAPVHLMVRDPVSGTHLGFKELAMANNDYGTNIQFFTNYVSIAAAVAKDPIGVGYSGLDAATPAGTKVVSIDGVAPSAATVNAKKYPYTRKLFFYTDAMKEPASATDFINFTLSTTGQNVLTQMGYAPKP